MKATINGVAVEGTPQEIIEYQRMQEDKAEQEAWARKVQEVQRKTGSGSTGTPDYLQWPQTTSFALAECSIDAKL